MQNKKLLFLLGLLAILSCTVAEETPFKAADYGIETAVPTEIVQVIPDPPEGLGENERIIKYEKYIQADGNYQEEWTIEKFIPEPRVLLTWNTPTQLVEGQETVALFLLDVAPELIIKLTDWRDSCATWLGDSNNTNDPANQVPKDSLNGLSEIEFCEAQVAGWTYIIDNNGGAADTNFFTSNITCPNCVQAVKVIRETYTFVDGSYSEDLGGGQFITDDEHLIAWSNLDGVVSLSLVSDLPTSRTERYVLAHFECVNGCTQYPVPLSDAAKDGFSEGAGDGDGDMWDEVDEGVNGGTPDAGVTYWGTGTGPSQKATPTSCAVVASDVAAQFNADSSFGDPGVGTGHGVNAQSRKTGTRRMDFNHYFCEGATPRATKLNSDIGTGFSTFTDTLTTGEADAITDYTILDLAVDPFNVGGGAPSSFETSAHELEFPDAAGGAARRIIITQASN